MSNPKLFNCDGGHKLIAKVSAVVYQSEDGSPYLNRLTFREIACEHGEKCTHGADPVTEGEFMSLVSRTTTFPLKLRGKGNFPFENGTKAHPK
ncbi:MAG TPA: hypothetical protein VKF82_12610 [Candidatus Eremiobacteraceae bacterium]|nr:hypothetical protein [Candidatus Eremiobacteraceae bacterium]